MKLFKYAPCGDINPIIKGKDNELGISCASVVSDYSSILKEFVRINSIPILTVSRYKSILDSKANYENGHIITLEQIDHIVSGVITDNFYLKIRDNSFRFVHFGFDCIMYICQGHDDILSSPQNHKVTVVDVSSMLINTDIFDN